MQQPSFVDTQEFIALDSSQSENSQLKAMLSNLTRVHLLSAHKFDSFDDLIREYIQSGIEIFGLETGIVSRISDANYTVCDVISPLEVLEKGQEFALQDTYCKLVFDSQQVVGLPKVGDLAYMNTHPVYQNLKLEAYLSAPIYVDKELFGTLNFTSVTPRQHGFSDHERTLILLLANSIGAYLQLRQKEDSLKELNNRMKKFVGYVAHDLRNPIGAMLSMNELAVRSKEQPARLDRILQKIREAGESALELVTTILDTAALGRGKLELNVAVLSVEDLLENAARNVSEFALESANEIHTEIRGHQRIFADKERLLQALNNLLINAIKYSPKGSELQLRAEDQDNKVLITLRNSVGENEAKVSQHHTYKSIGFGQEIVQDILNAHDSTLEIDATENAYEVSFLMDAAKEQST